jgi:hypothetical protein
MRKQLLQPEANRIQIFAMASQASIFGDISLLTEMLGVLQRPDGDQAKEIRLLLEFAQRGNAPVAAVRAILAHAKSCWVPIPPRVLWAAIDGGKLSIVLELLSSGLVDIHAKNHRALRVAARRGSAHALRAVLEADGGTFASSPQGEELTLAVTSGDLAKVSTLLNWYHEHPSVSESESKTSTPHPGLDAATCVAAGLGELDALELLLDTPNANVNLVTTTLRDSKAPSGVLKVLLRKATTVDFDFGLLTDTIVDHHNYALAWILLSDPRCDLARFVPSAVSFDVALLYADHVRAPPVSQFARAVVHGDGDVAKSTLATLKTLYSTHDVLTLCVEGLDIVLGKFSPCPTPQAQTVAVRLLSEFLASEDLLELLKLTDADAFVDNISAFHACQLYRWDTFRVMTAVLVQTPALLTAAIHVVVTSTTTSVPTATEEWMIREFVGHRFFDKAVCEEVWASLWEDIRNLDDEDFNEVGGYLEMMCFLAKETLLDMTPRCVLDIIYNVTHLPRFNVAGVKPLIDILMQYSDMTTQELLKWCEQHHDRPLSPVWSYMVLTAMIQSWHQVVPFKLVENGMCWGRYWGWSGITALDPALRAGLVPKTPSAFLRKAKRKMVDDLFLSEDEEDDDDDS